MHQRMNKYNSFSFADAFNTAVYVRSTVEQILAITRAGTEIDEYFVAFVDKEIIRPLCDDKRMLTCHGQCERTSPTTLTHSHRRPSVKLLTLHCMRLRTTPSATKLNKSNFTFFGRHLNFSFAPQPIWTFGVSLLE